MRSTRLILSTQKPQDFYQYEVVVYLGLKK